MTNSVQQVIIEGGLVKIVQTETIKQASLEDFLPLLTTRQPIHIPNLPNGISHLGAYPKPNGETEVDVLVETPPTMRHITFKPAPARDMSVPETNYRLSFPWVYFAFNMMSDDPNLKGQWACSNWTIWWSKTRITSLNDKVNPVSLPNCYTDGRICFGNLGRTGFNTLADFVNGTINLFWTSTFNQDLSIRFPGGYLSFEQWQTASEHDPSIWNTWPELDLPSTRLEDLFRAPANRFAPVIVPGTIPAVPMPYTFATIDEWFNILSAEEKHRMIDYMNGAGQYTLRPTMP